MSVEMGYKFFGTMLTIAICLALCALGFEIASSYRPNWKDRLMGSSFVLLAISICGFMMIKIWTGTVA